MVAFVLKMTEGYYKIAIKGDQLSAWTTDGGAATKLKIMWPSSVPAASPEIGQLFDSAYSHKIGSSVVIYGANRSQPLLTTLPMETWAYAPLLKKKSSATAIGVIIWGIGYRGAKTASQEATYLFYKTRQYCGTELVESALTIAAARTFDAALEQFLKDVAQCHVGVSEIDKEYLFRLLKPDQIARLEHIEFINVTTMIREYDPSVKTLATFYQKYCPSAQEFVFVNWTLNIEESQLAAIEGRLVSTSQILVAISQFLIQGAIDTAFMLKVSLRDAYSQTMINAYGFWRLGYIPSGIQIPYSAYTREHIHVRGSQIYVYSLYDYIGLVQSETDNVPPPITSQLALRNMSTLLLMPNVLGYSGGSVLSSERLVGLKMTLTLNSLITFSDGSWIGRTMGSALAGDGYRYKVLTSCQLYRDYINDVLLGNTCDLSFDDVARCRLSLSISFAQLTTKIVEILSAQEVEFVRLGQTLQIEAYYGKAGSYVKSAVDMVSGVYRDILNSVMRQE